MQCGFEDGSGNYWGATPANWMAICVSEGYPIEVVTNGQWVVIILPSGSKIALGVGSAPSGTAFGMPTGFTTDKMLSIATPASFNDAGQPMAGVAVCGITGSTGILTYNDASNPPNAWDTYRTNLSELGEPMEVQQKMMRHSDIKTTMGYGDQKIDKRRRDANDKVYEMVRKSA